MSRNGKGNAGDVARPGHRPASAFGGASYATNAVKHSVGVTVGNKGWNYTPSYDQYGQKVHTGSGGTPGGEGRHGRSPNGDAAGVFGFGYGMFGIGRFRW